MRFWFLILFFIGSSFSVVAQSSLLKTPNEIEEKKPVVRDVYQEYWNTKVFNPYRDAEPVTFPLEIDFTGQFFEMPIIGPTTSRYGWRRGKAHKGIDLDLETGDLVKAVMDGKVRFAKYYSGFGNIVVVRHSNGLETIYAHLSKILVEPNDYVFAGLGVGLGGNTGKSTGSHLHFEARYHNHPINPEYLFDLEGTQQLQTNNKILVTQYWTQPSKHRSTKQSNIVIHKPIFQVEDMHQHHQPVSTVYQPTTTQPLVKANNTSLVKAKPTTPLQKETLPTITRTTHTIQKGENLRTIAEKHKTTIEKLCILNGLSRTSVIRVGQVININ